MINNHNNIINDDNNNRPTVYIKGETRWHAMSLLSGMLWYRHLGEWHITFIASPCGRHDTDGAGPQHRRRQPALGRACARLGRGDDTVGNPHRAQTYEFELFELIPLLRLDKQFPVERFEPTASQSAAPSRPSTALQDCNTTALQGYEATASALYYTILYYTILYYTILCYNILYYTILYYTMLYYAILYYTILQHNAKIHREQQHRELAVAE